MNPTFTVFNFAHSDYRTARREVEDKKKSCQVMMTHCCTNVVFCLYSSYQHTDPVVHRGDQGEKGST